MISKLRFNTVVGKKVLMAVTGLAMVVFLIGHLIGNLQLLWSGAQFNGYAHFLTAQPVVILIELGLLGIFLLHIIDAVVLLQGNYAARPVPYHTKKWGRSKSKRSKKTWASTMMMWTGIAILLFVPFHVWHMKYHNPIASARPDSGQASPVVVGVGSTGVNNSGATATSSKEAYDLALQVTNEFRNPLVAGIYMLAMILLGMHMYHAISSALTSVGANHPRYQTLIIWGGRIFTVVIAGGFLLIPALILSGLIDPAKTIATAQAASNQMAQVPMGAGK